jgi:flagellar hook-associated protein 2
MGRITSSIGLVSGVPIAETVEKLVALQTGPRDQLVASVKKTQERQTAVVDLTARIIALQFAGNALGQLATFDAVTATSSDTNALSVTAGASATVGSHQITVLRKAQSQQAITTGFASRTAFVGAGTLAYRFGGAVNPDTSLSVLNGGTGIPRGSIRITDRSGAAADIDLRYARTVGDVLSAINNNSTIQVTATVEGDAIRLTDRSGESLANLSVDEVGVGGKTAQALGLADIDVAENAATGEDIVKLGRGVQLSALNDGLGLRISETLPDLKVSLRDGSTVEIDLHKAGSEAAHATATTTALHGPNAQLKVTSVGKGADVDGVKIVFVDDPAVTVGNETAVYDETDPENKTLTFHIDAGNSTASSVAAAVANSPAVSSRFNVAIDGAGDGSGRVSVTDTGVTSGGAAIGAINELSLGELFDTINAIAPGKLKIDIHPDGDRLQLIDLTEDTGSDFTVEGLFGSQLVRDLGLEAAADGDMIDGTRILAGLNTVLLKSLDGGKGLGELGQLAITNRAGGSSSVDLSTAETLNDVIDLINAADAGVRAEVNRARNGINLVDTSGDSGALIIDNGDAETETARKLQLVTNKLTPQAESGSLNFQSVGENTLLTSLNGGNGIAGGRIRIYDSRGGTNSLNLATDSIKTVSDVIDAINALAVNVSARINDEGDGILLIDEAGGSQKIKVEDLAGHAARDLGILGIGGKVESDENTFENAIRGSSTIRIAIDADDTIDDVAAKINAREAGVTAGVLSDGTVFRLSLASGRSGDSGNVIYDTTGLQFQIDETVRGQDALVLYGIGENAATTVLATSRTNTFANLVSGLTIDVKNASSAAVTVSVTRSDTQAVTRAKAFVDAYNALQDKLKGYTSFDAATFKTGVLFGSVEALRIQSDVSRVMTSRVFGAGQFTSLKQFGIDFGQDGKLSFDETAFSGALTQDRAAVRQFFTQEDTGFIARVGNVADSLAGVDRSLLVSRAQTLGTQITNDNERVDFLNARLEKTRDKLLLQFYRMEAAIAKVQSSLTAIQQIQAIPPLGAG